MLDLLGPGGPAPLRVMLDDVLRRGPIVRTLELGTGGGAVRVEGEGIGGIRGAVLFRLAASEFDRTTPLNTSRVPDRSTRSTVIAGEAVGADDGGAVRTREEIFGPVVAALPFDDEREVVRQANDSEYGLAAGIWTQDLGRAHRLVRNLDAGSVWVNQYNAFDTAMPFGGFKQSGWGRELGAESIDLYTETKSVNVAL